MASSHDPADLQTLLTDFLDQHAEWFPDELALAQGDLALTWREFSGRVRGLADGLLTAGIGRRDRVAVIADNAADFVVLQYALATMGGILVPVNTRLSPREIAHILTDAEPAFLLCSTMHAATARAAAELAGQSLTGPCCVDDPPGPAGRWAWVDQAIRAGELAARPGDDFRPDWSDTIAILYTGGTTGPSKGAEISHRRNVLDGLSAGLAFGLRRSDRLLCHSPLSHTSAWDYIRTTFLLGGSVVIAERFDAEDVIKSIQRWSCTYFWAVPLVLGRIISAPGFRDADMSSVRLICYSAYDPSDILVTVADEFRRHGAAGIRLAHGYGLTEAGPFLTILRPDESAGHPNCIGTPVPGVRVALLDEAGQITASGQPGEICARTAAVMTGYWRNPEATRHAFRGGWLHTGDIGRVNEHGHLVMVDRMKDVIRTAGENVYAKEVETMLVGHDEVEDCAVIGQPDPEYDERVVAVVVRKPGSAVAGTELRAYLRGVLAHFKVPRSFVFADELPKTTAGKTDKPALRAKLGSTFTGAASEPQS